MKDWILKKLLGTYLRQGLDIIPGNGGKTVVSVIMTAATILSFAFAGTDYSIARVLEFLVSILVSLNAAPLLSDGDIALLVQSMATVLFLFHKLLKRISGRPETPSVLGARRLGLLVFLLLLFPRLSYAQALREDRLHISGDEGIAALSKRTDTPATSASADGRYATINSNASGALWTAPIGQTTTVCASPTVSTDVYATGESVGGLLTLPNLLRAPARSGLLQDIAISDAASQITTSNLEVCVFNADPSNTTFTDQAALDIADTDLSKLVICRFPTSVTAFADNSAAFVSNVGAAIAASTANLYLVLVSRGTPDFATATDVTVCLTVFND